jgi:hypothetical protein
MKEAIISAIEQHAMNRPRSLQQRPGPSDLAQDCDHCLAAKLAGWQKRPDPAWLAYIGTAVHIQLGEALPAPWLSEVQVTVGTIAGEPVDGHADAWNPVMLTVLDFKIVGTTTMRQVRRGQVPPAHRKQVHTYGRGLGAKHVAVLYLPRNEPSLRNAEWWTEPYDAALADAVIFRARYIARLVAEGRPVQDFPRAAGCYDCARYDDAPGVIIGNLSDLFN